MRSIVLVGVLGALLFASRSGAASDADEKPLTLEQREESIQKSIAELPEADRKLALAQRYCPVTNERLGSMGAPIKLNFDRGSVFVCCQGCEEQAKADEKATLARVDRLKKIAAAMSKLTLEDRSVAESQRFCAVKTKGELGSMGPPVRFLAGNDVVYLCCAGCERAAKAKPQAALKAAQQLQEERRQSRETPEHGRTEPVGDSQKRR